MVIFPIAFHFFGFLFTLFNASFVIRLIIILLRNKIIRWLLESTGRLCVIWISAGRKKELMKVSYLFMELYCVLPISPSLSYTDFVCILLLWLCREEFNFKKDKVTDLHKQLCKISLCFSSLRDI